MPGIWVFLMFFAGLAYTYVMCATWEDDVSPQRQYASKDVNLYSQNSAHGHQPKGGQSCADGT